MLIVNLEMKKLNGLEQTMNAIVGKIKQTLNRLTEVLLSSFVCSLFTDVPIIFFLSNDRKC